MNHLVGNLWFLPKYRVVTVFVGDSNLKPIDCNNRRSTLYRNVDIRRAEHCCVFDVSMAAPDIMAGLPIHVLRVTQAV